MFRCISQHLDDTLTPASFLAARASALRGNISETVVAVNSPPPVPHPLSSVPCSAATFCSLNRCGTPLCNRPQHRVV